MLQSNLSYKNNQAEVISIEKNPPSTSSMPFVQLMRDSKDISFNLSLPMRTSNARSRMRQESQ
jgi:hypothetical protein